MNLHLPELTALAWLQFLQVTALIAAVGLLAGLVCRRRPHLAYVLWILVLLKCLTPPLWSSPAGIFSWAQIRLIQPEPVPQASEPVATIPAISLPRSVETALETRNRFSSGKNPAANDKPADTIGRSGPARGFFLSWPSIFAGIWLAGAIALTGVVLSRWLAFSRMLKRSAAPADAAIEALAVRLAGQLGLRRKITILATPKSLGPAVFGLFRPVIVLPKVVIAEKTQKQIEPIIAHELVHVRRGDVVWGFLQIAAEVLWWFHPLVWWANRQTCRQRERCCDEEVVASLECKPAVYAHCLLDALESERNWRPILAVPGFKSIGVTSKRLEDIMLRAKNFHRQTPRWCWAVLAIAAVLVLPGREIVLGGGQSASAQDQQKTSQSGEKMGNQSKSETIITGQVLDPAGKPLPGARVAIVGRSKYQTKPLEISDGPKTLNLTKTDGQGRFRMEIPRISSAAYYKVDVLAAAEGCGLGVQSIGLDVERPDITVRLPEEQIINGRVVDANQKPVDNAKVLVVGIGNIPLARGIEVIHMYPPDDLPIWPKPVTTDKDGCFTLKGLNCDRGLWVRLDDDRFAVDWAELKIPSNKSEQITLTFPSSQIVEGDVKYEDTQKPVPYARIIVGADAAGQGTCIERISGRADANGHFRIVPYSGKVFDITAYPPEGEPYLTVRKQYKLTLPALSNERPISIGYQDAEALPEGATAPKPQIALPRGILIRGQIVSTPAEKAAGRAGAEPVAGANIQYDCVSKNPYNKRRDVHILMGWENAVSSDVRGKFQIAVLPGRGMLLVYGPSSDYIYQEKGGNEMFGDGRGGRRISANAIVPLDLKEGLQPPELTISILRGLSVRGRLVGPDDRPIPEALMVSRLCVTTDFQGFRDNPVAIRDGQFELSGLDVEKPVPVLFLDSKDELGAVVEISGKSADAQPLVVHLKPCGKAVARFVDPDGKPLAKYEPDLQIVVTPGPSAMVIQEQSRNFLLPRNNTELQSNQDFVSNFDREHYWKWGSQRTRQAPVTDEQGRCTFPALIPGATYRLYARQVRQPVRQGFQREVGRNLGPRRYCQKE